MPCKSAGGVSHHALRVSRPTPGGQLEGSGQGGLHAHTRGELRGLTRGLFRPTPGGLQAHTQGVSRLRYFPWRSRLNQTNQLFLEDILLEPSCSFEGDVTTDH